MEKVLFWSFVVVGTLVIARPVFWFFIEVAAALKYRYERWLRLQLLLAWRKLSWAWRTI
jgi:hypothetical protein